MIITITMIMVVIITNGANHKIGLQMQGEKLAFMLLSSKE